jgi:hypothetical protein
MINFYLKILPLYAFLKTPLNIFLFQNHNNKQVFMGGRQRAGGLSSAVHRKKKLAIIDSCTNKKKK